MGNETVIMGGCEKKRRNVGADLLRILACYAVVTVHVGIPVRLVDWAVPVFMMVSFCFGKYGDDVDKMVWLLGRIKRIYFPFAFWGCLAFVLQSIVDESVDFKILFSQLIFGAPANPPLWFMVVLIVCTGLISAFVKFKFRTVVLFAVVIGCFAAEYMGINAWAVKALPFWQRMTMGRIVEMLPYAIFGYWLAHLRSTEKIRQIAIAGMALLVLGLLLKLLHCEILRGDFSYGGIVRAIGVSGLVMTCFALNEFIVIPKAFCRCIIFCASLTPGIYYSHMIVGCAMHLTLPVLGGICGPFCVFLLAAGMVFLCKRTHYLSWCVK